LLDRTSCVGTTSMFVGHFAIAFLLWRLFPQVPLPVVLIAVSFPDLLWSLLVPAGIEKVRINPDSPLQKFIVFEKFPYSHSLVLGSVLSLPIGISSSICPDYRGSLSCDKSPVLLRVQQKEQCEILERLRNSRAVRIRDLHISSLPSNMNRSIGQE